MRLTKGDARGAWCLLQWEWNSSSVMAGLRTTKTDTLIRRCLVAIFEQFISVSNFELIEV